MTDEIISSYYYEDGLSLNEKLMTTGLKKRLFQTYDNDGSGNYNNIVELKDETEKFDN